MVKRLKTIICIALAILYCSNCGRKSDNDDSPSSQETFIPAGWDGLSDLASESWKIETQ